MSNIPSYLKHYPFVIMDPCKLQSINISDLRWDWEIKLPYKFKTQSGKIIEISNDDYHKLKEETQIEIEKYRIR